ncbi:MAG: alpha-amylase family protein [Acidimicrobiales bacterium]
MAERRRRERIELWSDDLMSALAGLYPTRAGAMYQRLVDVVVAASKEREPSLLLLDSERERGSDWYLHNDRVGYAAYVDRLGHDFKGLGRRVSYLRDLGVNVLHLMSVLQPRGGDNDGGFAIKDYRRPDPRLGTLADFKALIDRLRNAGISTCVDLVMNHTSSDHEWAVEARRGSDYHRGLYLTFPDRQLPDAYERTLPEVFPTMSPGNFTWVDEMNAWVWTTFRDFQWDLNWANPCVMFEMAEILLHLANLGVEIVRLDAVAFTWKRLGTNCQNQPEAHLIAQALRAVLGMAAPASILLAEAIVSPDDLVAYLGHHERERRECQLAYHNQLMVQAWSMLATGEANLATAALDRLPQAPSGTTWLTYVRCHDDIGWAVADPDATAVGLDGAAHRAFLARFYRGDFPMSFARGVPFSTNAVTGDERTSGMTSALAGIDAGISAGDPAQVEQGVARMLMLYAIIFGFGGVPMIYMGDEVGLGDDITYMEDPERAGDSRWRHRPPMDETRTAQRNDPSTVAGALWSGLRRLVAARKGCRPLQGSGAVRVVPSGNPKVFAWARFHPRYGRLLGLANVSSVRTRAPEALLGHLDLLPVVDLLAPSEIDFCDLGPFTVRWLTADQSYRTAPTAELSAWSQPVYN